MALVWLRDFLVYGYHFFLHGVPQIDMPFPPPPSEDATVLPLPQQEELTADATAPVLRKRRHSM